MTNARILEAIYTADEQPHPPFFIAQAGPRGAIPEFFLTVLTTDLPGITIAPDGDSTPIELGFILGATAMNQAMFRKSLFAGVLAVGTLLVSGLHPLSGQEAKEKKAKGRLPAYYADIVTEPQRQQIYGVQAKYAKQIAELNAQLDALMKQRDAEIEGLLNADQRERLKKSQEDATAKKKKATADKKVADDQKVK